MLAVIILCLSAAPCDRAHATDVIAAPCQSQIPTACLIEAQERLAQTALGRDMRGMTVRIGVERVRHRLEVAK